MKNLLNKKYPGRIVCPSSSSKIPQNQYVAYIFVCNNQAVVVGHGKRNRAKVIFDSINPKAVTKAHIKALFVRLYHLYEASPVFERYIIPCSSKQEAQKIENELHSIIGGNSRTVPHDIEGKLFSGLHPSDRVFLLIKIMFLSSYSGIYDLENWYKRGLISDVEHAEINRRFGL